MAYNQITTRGSADVMAYRPRNFSEFTTDLAVKQQLLQEIRAGMEAGQMLAQASDAGAVGAAPRATYGNVPKWGQAPPETAAPTQGGFQQIAPPPAVEAATPAGPSRSERMLQQMRQAPAPAPQAPAGGGYGAMSPEIDEEMRRRERIRKMTGQ